MIRVFQADDHAIVRDGMKWLLLGEDDIELVGEAADGEAAIFQIEKLKPDVVLLDLQMPKLSGLDALPKIKEASPNSKIIVITSFSDDDYLLQAFNAGATSYLLKDTHPQKLLRTIRSVASGQATLEPEIAQKLLEHITKNSKRKSYALDEQLTEREIEILKFVAKGLTNLEISEQLVVSERTVRTHVSNILGKLHLANRTQAALYALREGIAKLDD